MRVDDLRIHYEAKQLGEVVDQFRTAGGNVGLLTPLIGEELHSEIIGNFENQRGHQQGPWPPRKDPMKRGGEHPLLRDTSVMFGSLTMVSDAEGAEVYTNVPYAKYHVSHEPRTKMPLRDFFDIDTASVTEYSIELITDSLASFSTS